MSIAEQMGRALQRSSISVNIKERLDFSCAMFGPDGTLVANAPHLPVHLGAMSEAVKAQIKYYQGMLWSKFLCAFKGDACKETASSVLCDATSGTLCPLQHLVLVTIHVTKDFEPLLTDCVFFFTPVVPTSTSLHGS